MLDAKVDWACGSPPAKILVTGGAGYIGSHACLLLEQAGYEVVILDNLIHGHAELVTEHLKAELIVGDLADSEVLNRIFSSYDIAAVMHFAAYAYVGESIQNPRKYYKNNIAATLNLLEAMLDHRIDKIVFSSTCATYGLPQSLPIREDHPQVPINPYGASKLLVERILKDFQAAYGLNSVIFRYFNAAGADPQGRLGEDHDPEPHLIPSVLLAALGRSAAASIFGIDYPTRDGTCIRDYGSAFM
jgi:UDP-glucose 4-epimerase